ncbi:hypothetical protein ACNF42_00315 [Cuniculiplasma sp. SKW3]|uniref:hypothetical protein n=1 Tax=Cuniculiplasma sp. SKW3 TaxID=3400170 RepID=UPI003FD15EE9
MVKSSSEPEVRVVFHNSGKRKGHRTNIVRKERLLASMKYAILSLFFILLWFTSLPFIRNHIGLDIALYLTISILAFLALLFYIVFMNKKNHIKDQSLTPILFLSLTSLESLILYLILIFTPKFIIEMNFISVIIPELFAIFFFSVITSGYSFNKRFTKVSFETSIKISGDKEGNVKSIERSDLIDDNIASTIQDRISGRITDEEFQNRLNQLDNQRQLIARKIVEAIEKKYEGRKGDKS